MISYIGKMVSLQWKTPRLHFSGWNLYWSKLSKGMESMYWTKQVLACVMTWGQLITMPYNTYVYSRVPCIKWRKSCVKLRENSSTTVWISFVHPSYLVFLSQIDNSWHHFGLHVIITLDEVIAGSLRSRTVSVIITGNDRTLLCRWLNAR